MFAAAPKFTGLDGNFLVASRFVLGVLLGLYIWHRVTVPPISILRTVPTGSSDTGAAKSYVSLMFVRRAAVAGKRYLSAMAQSTTPMEDAMRTKITEALKPSTLEIFNDSHLHSHHKAMQGVTSKETHFRAVITSEAFKGKMQPARHRMVYSLLKDEMAQDGGIHALQLKTRTPEEEERQKQKEAAEQ